MVLDEDKINRVSSSDSQISRLATNLAPMSVDQLWAFHQELGEMLANKIASELDDLKRRLTKLRSGGSDSPRRRYAKVRPKYRNPERPLETWAGRGRAPRWVKAQLSLGRRLDDFRIDR
jgi:DNA-binding protein H-NS